jgi:squalene-associated FAD-dependent desaturase
VSRRVAIIGGGLAGLSAAESLARDHRDQFQVTLFEAKSRTGGRAGSFTDPASGQTVDYCQHVAMGCCTNLIGLLQRCGLANYWQRSSDLVFLHPGVPASRFSPARLPAPFHMFGMIGALRFLTRSQQRQIRRALFQLLRTPTDAFADQTAGDWLRDQRQDGDAIAKFWDVILVSALGEESAEVSMQAVRKVIVDGFASAHGASDLLIPKLPLAELVGDHLTQAISTLGVQIRCGTLIRAVTHDQQTSVVKAEAQDGCVDEFDLVIAAVPWHAIGKLLPGIELPGSRVWESFPTSAITGVHLWFDREITELPHAVLVGSTAQWIFRVSDQHYQVVISASRNATRLSQTELVATVVGELRQVLPRASAAKLLRSRVVTDPRAVFSIRPEVDACRPAAYTALPWLRLAGDWTATGWPATMEGAVISGRLAAASLFEQDDSQSIRVDPGLRRGWFVNRIAR